MATKNKLSVYLVKEGITSANDIFEDPGKIRVLERYSENSAAYFVPSLAHEPNWLRNFFLRGGDGMMRMGDHMAMDMDTGDIHMISSWSDDDEE